METSNLWVEVQKKAFTRWVNTHLQKRDLQVTSLENDFKNGINLIHLLEILTSKSIRYNRRPRLDVQMMENLTNAIKFLTEQGVHLVNIGPGDIHDGNLKLILGLLWTIILHYKIKAKAAGNESGSSVNKELLAWVNSLIPQFGIKNFTSNWQDGKALCALVEALKNGTISPTDLNNDPIHDCNVGITKAKNAMGIPVILDAEDIARNPDEKAMITYISYFQEYQKNAALMNLNNNNNKNENNNKEQEELAAKELTPVLEHCIVYGPGLENGNDMGGETYFTVEVRNIFDRKVPRGGHNVVVKITGPHSQNSHKAIDNQDGTYYVRYVPTEDGNYVIEVTLDGRHIKGSPFHVSVNKVTQLLDTIPIAHWYSRDKKDKRWVPYPDDVSAVIEKQWNDFHGGKVKIMNAQYEVDLNKKEETPVKKGLFSSQEKEILRGIWFWQDDDNTWVPYEDQIAALLEQKIKSGWMPGGRVELPGKKKLRYIHMDEAGNFKQHRVHTEANPKGRPVQRGYLGQVVEVRN